MGSVSKELTIRGKKIKQVPVSIGYRILELFSAGLYSSPNKAFEKLVANSYDAHATKVHVILPTNLEAIRTDMSYAQRWSPLLDVYVLLRNVPIVLLGKGS